MQKDTNLLAAAGACFLIATAGAFPATAVIGTMLGLTHEDADVSIILVVWFVAWLAVAGYIANKRTSD